MVPFDAEFGADFRFRFYDDLNFGGYFLLHYFCFCVCLNFGACFAYLPDFCDLKKLRKTNKLRSKTNVTNLLWLFLFLKSWKKCLIFHLHFTQLYASWNCQRILKNYPFWKDDSWFLSEVSKFTSVRNMLDLSLKYWFMEAKIAFWICYGTIE